MSYRIFKYSQKSSNDVLKSWLDVVPKDEGAAHVENKSWERMQGPEVRGKPLESSACFSGPGQVCASGSISFKCVVENFPSYSHGGTGKHSSLDLWQS